MDDDDDDDDDDMMPTLKKKRKVSGGEELLDRHAGVDNDIDEDSNDVYADKDDLLESEVSLLVCC